MKVIGVERRGPSAERNALRRASAQTLTEEPDLQALHDLSQELSGAAGVLQIEHLTPRDGEDGPPIEVVVDPEAESRGEVMLGALEKEGEQPGATAEPAARLRGNLGRHAALSGCQAAAQQLDEDLGDTERWAAKEEGRHAATFYRLLDGYLDGSLGRLSKAERDQLRAAAAPMLRLREDAGAERGGEADRTRAAVAEAGAIIAEGAREAHMVETALDLSDDRPVSAADLAAAIDTFHALGTGPAQ